MKRKFEQWKLYELFIARMMVDQSDTDVCVTPNAYITGKISGRKRQIDVLIEARHDRDSTRRVIVDAKARSRKVDVIQVEAFRGLMEDVGAVQGILVCCAGHTEAAKKRAQEAVSICLIPLERLADFDPTKWEKCLSKNCKTGLIFWDGFPEVSLGVRPVGSTSSIATDRIPFVHYVGKCERCYGFHVKCLACGEMFFLGNEDDCQCRCGLPWFWLSSIETDEQGNPSAELHLVTGSAEILTVDRRPL